MINYLQKQNPDPRGNGQIKFQIKKFIFSAAFCNIFCVKIRMWKLVSEQSFQVYRYKIETIFFRASRACFVFSIVSFQLLERRRRTVYSNAGGGGREERSAFLYCVLETENRFFFSDSKVEKKARARSKKHFSSKEKKSRVSTSQIQFFLHF